MQELEIRTCCLVDGSTNRDCITSIQVVLGGYHENKVIKFNTK